MKVALDVAHHVYGGVDENSPQWKTCLDVADTLLKQDDTLVSIQIDTSFARAQKAQASFALCEKFNKKYPTGTVGFVTSPLGERLVAKIEQAAMVFAHPLHGETVMAFFTKIGWVDVNRFGQEAHTLTLWEELTLMGQDARKHHKFQMAIALNKAALAANPDYWHAMNEIGVTLGHQMKFEEALPYYNRAVEITPTSGEVLNNRAMALRAVGRPQESVDDCMNALKYIPGNDLVALNAAAALDDIGRTDEGLAIVDDYIRRHPDNYNSHYNKAITLLSASRLPEGWVEFDWRFLQPMTNAHYEHYKVPRWNGEQDLKGKSVLIWGEQGLGDEMLTATMIPDAIEAGANVTLLCSERLIPLMRRAFPTIKVDHRPAGGIVETFKREPLQFEFLPLAVRFGRFDLQMSQSDLGKLFRPTIDSFPERSGYLKAHFSGLEYLQQLKSAHPGKKLIGISWHSNGNVRIGTMKSVGLKTIAPILLMDSNAVFINLQYGDNSAEIAAVEAECGVKIVSFPDIDPLVDLDAYAGLVAAMDLVITASNTLAHVAGGLNVPTWIMCPEGPGRLWYWFRNRTDSPWYSSVKLYRQPVCTRWDTVVVMIATDLVGFVHDKPKNESTL